VKYVRSINANGHEIKQDFPSVIMPIVFKWLDMVWQIKNKKAKAFNFKFKYTQYQG